MTWRITEYVERGELDNRELDHVIGRIWLRGLEAPVQLDLVGNPLPDLAGLRLEFKNPAPGQFTEAIGNFAGKQQGTVGEITAARRVKVPTPGDDDTAPFPEVASAQAFRWANCLYLEWFSAQNGRVVIEATDFELAIDGAPGTETSSAALTALAEDLCADDAPQSRIEAEAEEDAAAMALLFDRIAARVGREEYIDAELHNRIIREERNRLRAEQGRAPLEAGSPEADEAEALWLIEFEARREEVFEADLCPLDEDHRHPLVEQCQDYSLQLQEEIEIHAWAPEHANAEHPLHAITNSLCSAAAKLAGALNQREESLWEIDLCIAADSLVRLKAARRHLRDAVFALQAVKEAALARADWIENVHHTHASLLAAVQAKIDTVRAVLREAETDH